MAEMKKNIAKTGQSSVNVKSVLKTLLKFMGKFCLVLIIIIGFAVVFLYGTINRIINGNSPAARDLFVKTVMETSSGHFLAQWFLSDEQIQHILTSDFPVTEDPTEPVGPETPTEPPSEMPTIPPEDKNSIRIVEVKGGTYKGLMMIVRDPSRIKLVTSYPFTPGGKGLKLAEMVKRNKAVAGINGGGFIDVEGNRGGDEPIGLVICEGQLLCGSVESEDKFDVIGFNQEHRLIVGSMTAQSALNAGLYDAISFSPTLIKNGVARNLYGRGGGLNPRTAIGQREDGTVLLLVIDGRQPQSLGATLSDLVDIMVNFGAVNAGNLDGGSSTLMIHEGQIINKCCSLYGPRRIPTGFVVLASEEE